MMFNLQVSDKTLDLCKLMKIDYRDIEDDFGLYNTLHSF